MQLVSQETFGAERPPPRRGVRSVRNTEPSSPPNHPSGVESPPTFEHGSHPAALNTVTAVVTPASIPLLPFLFSDACAIRAHAPSVALRGSLAVSRRCWRLCGGEFPSHFDRRVLNTCVPGRVCSCANSSFFFSSSPVFFFLMLSVLGYLEAPQTRFSASQHVVRPMRRGLRLRRWLAECARRLGFHGYVKAKRTSLSLTRSCPAYLVFLSIHEYFQPRQEVPPLSFPPSLGMDLPVLLMAALGSPLSETFTAWLSTRAALFSCQTSGSI